MCGNILSIQCFTPLTESNIVCGSLIASKYQLPFPHLAPGNSDTNCSLAIQLIHDKEGNVNRVTLC